MTKRERNNNEKKWGWVGIQMNHYQQKEKQRKDLWGQKTKMHKCAFVTVTFLATHAWRCFLPIVSSFNMILDMYHLFLGFLFFAGINVTFQTKWCSTYSEISCPIDRRQILRQYWLDCIVNHFICDFSDTLEQDLLQTLFQHFSGAYINHRPKHENVSDKFEKIR